jgi:hypothetical protein
MPGLGKTTWVKRQNEGKQEGERPAIDFDYKGTRFHDSKEVAVAQAHLLNAFAKQGVKAITTFPQMIDFDSLNPTLFEVVVVLPEKGNVKELVNRAVDRGDDPQQPFLVNYTEKGEQWRDDWEDLFYRKIRPRFPDAELITTSSGQYFSDVIPDLEV